MLSDNIRNYRKKLNLSQDELAEKVGVSRQSVSFWETGQTQPTIDNIIALTKIFNITSDMLLGNSNGFTVTQEKMSDDDDYEDYYYEDEKSKTGLIIGIIIAVAVIVGIIIFILPGKNKDSKTTASYNSSVSTSSVQLEASSAASTEAKEYSSKDTGKINNSKVTDYSSSKKSTSSKSSSSSEKKSSSKNSVVANTSSTTVAQKFDLFSYCKDFSIEKGELNGDYCIYQQPSDKYGGYKDEYFSISYWADSDMVEFCLHCPLDETYSHNFYLRMRGGYNKKYEYLSSKYYRDTGESLRSATGYINPKVFYDGYPISCDEYIGSVDGQTEFMEESRVGVCDLIRCLKKFVVVENMECDFSDFDFDNF